VLRVWRGCCVVTVHWSQLATVYGVPLCDHLFRYYSSAEHLLAPASLIRPSNPVKTFSVFLSVYLSVSNFSRSFLLNVLNTDSCLHSLLPPPRPPAVTSRLRSSQIFPKSILTHTATLFSYNMALIITSIKPINPSYFTIVCAHPGSAACWSYCRNVLCRLSNFTDSFVFHCFYRAAWNAQTRSSDENSVRLSVCPSVCLSVKRVHCDKTKEKSVQLLYYTKDQFSVVF